MRAFFYKRGGAEKFIRPASFHKGSALLIKAIENEQRMCAARLYASFCVCPKGAPALRRSLHEFDIYIAVVAVCGQRFIAALF